MKLNITKRIKHKILIYIILFVVVIAALIILTNGLEINCFFNKHFGFLCPSCGATRALFSILHFDLLQAMKYNAFFTLVVYPFFAFLLLQDLILTIKNLFKGSNSRSLIEFILKTNNK